MKEDNSRGELHRFNPDLHPRFRPKEDISLEAQEIDAWGGRGIPGDKGATAASIYPKWMVGAAVLFMFGGFGIVAFTVVHNATEPLVVSHSSRPSPVERLKDYQRIFRAFASSKTIHERLEYVRHPKLTRPRMTQSHKKRPVEPIMIESFVEGAIQEQRDNVALFAFDVVLVDGTQRTAYFEETNQGPKLDWETLVLYEELPFEDFVQRQPAGPRSYRLYVKSEPYHNFQYADADAFLSLRLENSTRRAACWGYAPRDSPLGRDLQRLLERMPPEPDGEFRGPIKVTMTLNFIPDKDGQTHSQVLIEEIVSENWFVP